MNAPRAETVSRMLDSFGEVFTPDVARKVADYRFDKRVQTRLRSLARRCNEGQLSEQELEEYRACVEIIDFIALLQAKALVILKRKQND